MAEFKQNLARYDVSFVSIHDDNFTTDPHWVEEFCEVYRKEVNLPWYCFGYPTTIKPRLVKAMKAANCAPSSWASTRATPTSAATTWSGRCPTSSSSARPSS